MVRFENALNLLNLTYQEYVMKKLVSELSGAELDYWVGAAEGVKIIYSKAFNVLMYNNKSIGLACQWSPSTKPEQAYPIIERDKISVSYYFDTWGALMPTRLDCDVSGETTLIAAMRCKVASVFGEYVDMPNLMA